MNKQLTTFTIVAVIIAGGAFFGGIKYGQAKAKPAQTGQFMQGTAGGGRTFMSGAAGARRAGNGNNFINGEIISKDSTGITVQLRNGPGNASSTPGGSKIVILAGSTQILKSDLGTASDLSVGQNVVVTGTDNSDGSLTAQTVQIRTDLPGMQGPGGQR